MAESDGFGTHKIRTSSYSFCALFWTRPPGRIQLDAEKATSTDYQNHGLSTVYSLFEQIVSSAVASLVLRE
jgi:hypothetical protein